MKHFNTFNQFNESNSSLSNELFDLLEGRVSLDEINNILNSTMDEGFFSWLKGIFTNGSQKRVLDKWAGELFKTLVKKGTLQLQGDPIEELENDLEDED